MKLPVWLRAVRAVRSTTSLAAFFAYLLLVMGPLQRVIVFPLVWLLPARRTRMLGAWIRAQARVTRAIVRYGAGVRIHVSGPPIRESCIVVMNHQSVLDVMIALCEVEGPTALIPVRTRYQWGMPGISPFLRVARYPFITQRRSAIRGDLAAIEDGAARVASGEATIILYPEGHRTRTGDIGPFMPGGLSTALAKARKPVYCVVGDGMWQVRTIADGLVGLAGVDVTVRISGPVAPPEREEEIPQFIASLRDRMVASLADLRAELRIDRKAPVNGSGARAD